MMTTLETLARTLEWSKARDYSGYSKHDALNSPLLNALTLNTKLLRLVVTQAVMRCPLNLRPLFAVPKRRNPKGIGLFAHAYLDLAQTLKQGEVPSDGSGLTSEACMAEAERLLSWLIHHASPWTPAPAELRAKFACDSDGETACMNDEGSDLNGVATKTRLSRSFALPLVTCGEGEGGLCGLGWGYHYPWQDTGFFQPRHFPNRVVSCWIGFAFVRAFEATGEARYLDATREIVAFLLGNPKRLIDTESELSLSYIPSDAVKWGVVDVSALSAALCARFARHAPGQACAGHDPASAASRLMRYVINRQTDYGAWHYADPPARSHITHDNYHTGIILDCIADTMQVTDDQAYRDAYRKGVEYYRDHLFLADGAPKWMCDRSFPHDVHGAAAGILAFTHAARFFGDEAQPADPAFARECGDRADLILEWTLNNLHDRAGFFMYQKGRFFTKRFCLMRWCNAWMSRALAARHLPHTP